MAKSLARCLVGSLVAGLAAAAPAGAEPRGVIEARAPAVAAAANTLPLARKVHDLVGGGLPRPFHRVLLEVVDSATGEPAVAVGAGIVRAEQRSIEYLTEVQVGPTQKFNLIVDTGSSDTWIARHDFQCLIDDPRIPKDRVCIFGNKFQGDFPGGKIPNQYLNISYGFLGGPNILGDMGYSDLGLAGITVPKQQIGLATKGRWDGDEKSSGILGLGLPGLTDSYSGDLPTATRQGISRIPIPYSPLIATVSNQSSHLFSLALTRNHSSSYISFGGIPPAVRTTNEWATTPLRKVSLRGGTSEYLYYQIGVERMEWHTAAGVNGTVVNGSDPKPPDYIVDSGTTLNLMPDSVAVRLNNAFTPRAVYNSRYQQWFVDCKAKAPAFGIQIAGKMLWTDPTSMILPEVKNEDGLCSTGIANTNRWPYILGDTFLQGLVAVFDTHPERMEMRFAKRTD